jgi:glycosyltransferase involved in cell wall biosynthesis
MTNTEHSRGVTAVIPSIPPRVGKELHRAVDSVLQQDWPVAGISVAVDHAHAGAAATRNRALSAVTTEFVAFLDDDDEWCPDHVRLLMECAAETGADMVYPWFTVPEGWDPWPYREGQPFDPVLLDTENYIPVTCLIRTEVIRSVGGFVPRNPDPAGDQADDWGAWLKIRDSGAKIVHLNRRSWIWHWHSGNTSGSGQRW